jgi:hypothetical protein
MLFDFSTDKWADPTNPFMVKPLGDELAKIEDAFWTSTPQLTYIAAMANRHGVSRWALLAAIETFILSWIPPYVVLSSREDETDIIYIGGSLNFYAHIIATSGAAKSALVNIARLIVRPNTDDFTVPQPFGGTAEVTDKHLLTQGTGEAFLKNIVRRKQRVGDDGKPTGDTFFEQQTASVVQIVGELSTFVAEYERGGTKAPGIFNSLWTGELVGTDTSDEKNGSRVPPHAVRACAVRIGHTSHAAKLFTDELIDDGSVQRPVWAPGDLRWSPNPITSAPAKVNPIQIPTGFNKHLRGYTQHTVQLPPEQDFPRPAATPAECVWIKQGPQEKADIAAFVKEQAADSLSPDDLLKLSDDEREARQGRAILGHAILTRRKVNVALAAIHGHPLTPTDQDWELSGVQMRVQLGMLAAQTMENARVTQKGNRQVGRNRWEQRQAEQEAQQDYETRVKGEIVGWAYDFLRTKGPQRAYALQHGSDAKKKLIPVALREDHERGGIIRRIYLADDGWYWAMVDGVPFDPHDPQRRPDGW